MTYDDYMKGIQETDRDLAKRCPLAYEQYRDCWFIRDFVIGMFWQKRLVAYFTRMGVPYRVPDDTLHPKGDTRIKNLVDGLAFESVVVECRAISTCSFKDPASYPHALIITDEIQNWEAKAKIKTPFAVIIVSAVKHPKNMNIGRAVAVLGSSFPRWTKYDWYDETRGQKHYYRAPKSDIITIGELTKLLVEEGSKVGVA